MHDLNNGYFSKQGIPYHCKETLIVEGPLYGHDSASETLSYYIWNEALYGKFTGDWDPLVEAWQVMEKYYIPSDNQQANMKDYNPKKPASYAPECNDLKKFPVSMDINAGQSSDPIHTELVAKYGSKIYDMHWLVDVDNWIGFGDGNTPTHYDSYARGPHESCWKAIPHPCEESFKYGASNGGFLPLYTQDTNYSKQNKWTNAPDASVRLTAAIYMAQQWSGGNNDKVNGLVTKCSQLMDWLRYCTFDKYFKPIGAQDKSATCNDLSSCHYLIGWYYAFGCPQVSNGWAFKIGCSHNHMGYQSPMAAWIASTQQPFTQNMTQSGPGHWGKSMNRQLQFYKWLQSQEGLFAGGATNCFNGQYDKYPSDLTTFFNMMYVSHPSYLEPPSNGWFGFQCWSGVRVMQYLYYSKDSTYEPMMAKWAKYVTDNIKDDPTLGLTIPASIEWTGCPDSNFSDDSGIPADNNNLHVKVTQYGQDTGIMAALATCLMYFAAYKNDYKQYKDIAKKLLDFILDKGKTDVGYSFTEQRDDYKQFNQEVYVPSDYQGVMPNGDKIASGATFLNLRSKYKDDPLWQQVSNCLQNNKTFEYKYHRFWSQSEILIALGTYDVLFNPQPTPETPQTPTSAPTPAPNPTATSPTTLTPSTPSAACTCNPCKCDGCDKTPTTKNVTMPGVVTTPGNSNTDLSKSEFELKVIGSKLTLKGQDFVLKGINWFGNETSNEVVEGLTTHTLDWYLDMFSTNKFNIIRIPFAWDLAKNIDKITPSEKVIEYKINPDLKGCTSGQIMDLLIKKAGDRGILIMLDMHRIHRTDNMIPALWYSDDAPEEDIIQVWKSMATRYKDYYNVVAFDIKNEGHDSIEVGTGSDKDLWRYFGKVGNELLKINPKALIFCEGYDKYVNKEKQIWNYPGWSSTIQVLQDGHKVDLSDPTKLVYSTHNYPKSVSGTEGNMTEDKLNDNFGFAIKKGIACVPGEWSCKSDGPDVDWMTFYANYLKKLGSTSQFFWTMQSTSTDTGGYLLNDWTTIDPLKQKILDDLNPNPPKITINGDKLQVQNLGPKITKAVVQETTQSSGDAVITPSPTNGPEVISKKTNEWTSGSDTIQQFDVSITNTTSSALQSLMLQVSNQSSIKQLWNMQQNDGNIYTLPSWKTILAPKETYTFGFQSTKPIAEFSLKSFQ